MNPSKQKVEEWIDLDVFNEDIVAALREFA